MTTFTTHQLRGGAARVLDVCDAEGVVQIRRRNGRSYTLTAEQTNQKGEKVVINPPDIMARLRKNFPNMMISKKQTAFVDKLIAGE